MSTTSSTPQQDIVTAAASEAAASASETVWLLVITHRHGENTSVHRTVQGATRALHAYITEQWDEEVNGRWREDGGADTPIPADLDEATTAYFEIVEDEGYMLDAVPLED